MTRELRILKLAAIQYKIKRNLWYWGRD